jgi:hypothetical protein
MDEKTVPGALHSRQRKGGASLSSAGSKRKQDDASRAAPALQHGLEGCEKQICSACKAREGCRIRAVQGLRRLVMLP